MVDRELDELLAGLPAISLEGPKGVGKTATAPRRARTTFRLDDPDAQLLDAVIVTTGPTAYRRRDGIAVVPAALLGP